MVLADIEEALASCEFLVAHLPITEGTWAITCDVGGSTIDTALCLPKNVGGEAIPKVYPIDCHGSRHSSSHHGVVKIDDDFEVLLRGIALDLQIENFAARHELDKVVFSDQWRVFRHSFQGESDFTVTLKNDLGNSVDSLLDGECFVQGRTITIKRYAIILLPKAHSL